MKHPLFPDNVFLYAIPQFPFSTGFPSDELLFLILGVFGEHPIGVHRPPVSCFTLVHIVTLGTPDNSY
jgi:hypothetical protein